MDTLIIGAGLTGLSCALGLEDNFLLVEKESGPGGLCRSERTGGFTLDRTGHYLHFRSADTKQLVLDLLSGNLASFSRDSWVFLKGIYTRYPFQANTFGHDPSLVRECVLGFLKAAQSGKPLPAVATYRDWLSGTFGDGIARHFLIPFNRKMFRTSPASLTPSQAGRFVPRPLQKDVIEGALFPKESRLGYNPILFHPKIGGIEALPRSLAAGLRSDISTGVKLTGIDWRMRRAVLGGRTRIPYDVLVSTMPLPNLLRIMKDIPQSIRQAAAGLKSVGVANVNFLVRKPVESRRHWVYFSEPRFPFYRLGFPSNVVRTDAPKGAGIISAEISQSSLRRLPMRVLENATRSALQTLGLVRSKRDILGVVSFEIPCAYVLFNKGLEARRAAIMSFLGRNGIASIGRYGGWRYSSMEDAIREGFLAGMLIARNGRRAPMMLAGRVAE